MGVERAGPLLAFQKGGMGRGPAATARKPIVLSRAIDPNKGYTSKSADPNKGYTSRSAAFWGWGLAAQILASEMPVQEFGQRSRRGPQKLHASHLVANLDPTGSFVGRLPAWRQMIVLPATTSCHSRGRQSLPAKMTQ